VLKEQRSRIEAVSKGPRLPPGSRLLIPGRPLSPDHLFLRLVRELEKRDSGPARRGPWVRVSSVAFKETGDPTGIEDSQAATCGRLARRSLNGNLADFVRIMLVPGAAGLHQAGSKPHSRVLCQDRCGVCWREGGTRYEQVSWGGRAAGASAGCPLLAGSEVPGRGLASRFQTGDFFGLVELPQ